MTIGSILSKCKNVKYVLIRGPKCKAKCMKIDEVNDSEMGMNFKQFEVSVYIGKVCLEFDI